MFEIDNSFSEEIYELQNSVKQVYPGQFIKYSDRSKFPDPWNVGCYIDKKSFLNTPKWPSSWVHWTNRCNNILAGEYDKIVPVHYEGIFTLLCNMMCPHCTRKQDRERAGAWNSIESSFDNIRNLISEKNTLNKSQIFSIIKQLKDIMVDNQMGIVWGGGDPTMNVATYEGIKFARKCGITSSLITNGVFLNINKLVDAQPTIVRISLNCYDNKTYNMFHGIKKEWGYHKKLWDNIKTLNSRKVNQDDLDNTLFGLSLIIDERNIEDFTDTIDRLVSLVEEDGKGIDYLIIRPVMKYNHQKENEIKIDRETVKNTRNLIGIGSYAKMQLDKVGIPLVPIKDSFNRPPKKDYYLQKNKCLAYGMCGEIRFNGDVQLCSDSYGNPDYTIGNIYNENLDDILKSNRRKDVLEKINKNNCFSKICPFNSRGHHLNRMFYQIEELRQQDKIEIAAKWVRDMRDVTIPIGHSFFI